MHQWGTCLSAMEQGGLFSPGYFEKLRHIFCPSLLGVILCSVHGWNLQGGLHKSGAKGGFPNLCFSLQWVLVLGGPKGLKEVCCNWQNPWKLEITGWANSMGQFLDMSLQTTADLLGKFLLFKIIFFPYDLGTDGSCTGCGHTCHAQGGREPLRSLTGWKVRGGRTTLANSFNALLISPCCAQGMEGVWCFC